MSRCQAILIQYGPDNEIFEKTCNSNQRPNKFYFSDPNAKLTQEVIVCQKCSDRITGRLREEEKNIREDKHLDYVAKRDAIWKQKRYHCQRCNHMLNCHCKGCQNIFDEIWTLSVYSNQNIHRASYHLHRLCALFTMKESGIDIIIPVRNGIGQNSMEGYLGYQLSEVPIVDAEKTTFGPDKYFCKNQDCQRWVAASAWQDHKNAHLRNQNSDAVEHKQFTGPRKMEEVLICHVHQKRAVRNEVGQMKCPVASCNNELSYKALEVRQHEDYMICMFHQDKLAYNTNTSKLYCPNHPTCTLRWIVRKSSVLDEVKSGYIIDMNGKKQPIDFERNEVILHGVAVMLKV